MKNLLFTAAIITWGFRSHAQTQEKSRHQKLDTISIDNWRLCLFGQISARDSYGAGAEINFPINSFGKKANNSLSFALTAGVLITPKSKYYSYTKNDPVNDFGVDTTLLYHSKIFHVPFTATFNQRLSIGKRSSLIFNIGLWGSYYSFDDWRTEAGYNNGNRRGNGGVVVGIAYRYAFVEHKNAGIKIGFEQTVFDNNGDGNGVYSRIGGLKIGLTF